MVPDVLFGCGEGFVGVHFKVKVGLKNFVSALPTIEGEIEVNTINDWAFGVEGKVELAKFALEVKLSFKSHNDIPVPDQIYFFVSGFRPGINLDGCGIVWLTGAGGGMVLAGVDLGISTEKIWGALEVLFIKLGITYYWGEGSVDFGSGGKTQPTYPELLGYEDIPVYYDSEGDRTLYARFGTNTALCATNMPSDGLVLMAGGARGRKRLRNRSLQRRKSLERQRERDL